METPPCKVGPFFNEMVSRKLSWGGANSLALEPLRAGGPGGLGSAPPLPTTPALSSTPGISRVREEDFRMTSAPGISHVREEDFRMTSAPRHQLWDGMSVHDFADMFHSCHSTRGRWRRAGSEAMPVSCG